MAEPINLNRRRKQMARDRKKQQADENSVRFGRTKAQKNLEDARREKLKSVLDQHKRDGSE